MIKNQRKKVNQNAFQIYNTFVISLNFNRAKTGDQGQEEIQENEANG